MTCGWGLPGEREGRGGGRGGEGKGGERGGEGEGGRERGGGREGRERGEGERRGRGVAINTQTVTFTIKCRIKLRQ